MNHTPGPWTFIGGTLVQDKGNRLHIGAFTEASGLGSAATANARLIAAAPELLAALQALLAEDGVGLHSYGCIDTPPGFKGHCCPIARARAAIARATV